MTGHQRHSWALLPLDSRAVLGDYARARVQNRREQVSHLSLTFTRVPRTITHGTDAEESEIKTVRDELWILA